MGAAIAYAIVAPSQSFAATRPAPAAAAAIPTQRLVAGEFQLTIERTAADEGERAMVRVTDAQGRPAAGKPLTGLLAYQGSAPGHEHKDILVSHETQPGLYALDLREVVTGPWLLTVVLGDDARAAYLFNVP